MTKEMDNQMTREDILMNEDQLISGLIEAANFKQDASYRRLVQIKRPTGQSDANGKTIKKVLFSFTVRPLGEDELMNCQRKSTRYLPNPNGPKWPKIEGETNLAEFRARRIYTATVDEDRKRLWDNPAIRERLNVIEGWEVVDKALMYMEKTAVINVIDDISGEESDPVDDVKN